VQSAPEGVLGKLQRSLTARFSALHDDIDADNEPRTRASDHSAAVACTVATLALVFMEYASERDFMRWVYRQDPSLYQPRFAQLYELTVWVAVRLLAFLVLPALAIRFGLHQRVVDHGLRVRGLPGHGRGYAALFLLVLPAIAVAASQPEFSRYYPFYKLASASFAELLWWELLYALHFVALEFFFRGFWLTALRPSFGSRAVYVAVAPYCMIHFSKPLLEVVAAIPAGIVLGLLAMRARSIWGGAALHVAVAYSMDALALWKTTGFPTRWLPRD
jgi:membrane protease YdiL (CAAX protease family)